MRMLRVNAADGSYAVLLVNPSVTDSYNAVVDNASGLKIFSKSYNTEPVVNGNIVTVEPGAYVLLGSSTLTGVKGIASDVDDSAIHAWGGEGRINVTGTESLPAVYTLSGVRCGTDGLAPGLYIVRVDGRTFKVTVR